MITPAAAFDHDRDDPPSDQPGPLQVDVEHRIPGVLGQLVGQAVAADARVVEQDVDAAEPIGGGGDGRADGSIVADVGGERQAVDAQRTTLLGQGLEVVGRAHGIAGISQRPRDIEGRDPDPLAGQRQGRRPPLPVRGAGDQRDLPGQVGRRSTAPPAAALIAVSPCGTACR